MIKIYNIEQIRDLNARLNDNFNRQANIPSGVKKLNAQIMKERKDGDHQGALSKIKQLQRERSGVLTSCSC